MTRYVIDAPTLVHDPITETKVRLLGNRMSRRTACAPFGQATSNRSLSMTLTHARTKSRTNFSPASALA